MEGVSVFLWFCNYNKLIQKHTRFSTEVRKHCGKLFFYNFLCFTSLFLLKQGFSSFLIRDLDTSHGVDFSSGRPGSCR